MVVNGSAVSGDVPARRLLIDFLRSDLRLTGTTVGCEHGVCGSCTVHVDGAAARSCLILAAQADGCEIRTIEGIGSEGELTAIQDAVARHHGVQCGFCTAGIVMTLEAAAPSAHGSAAAVRELLAGNVCRCTGYQKIVDAVLDVWGDDRD
jgi:aerobic-type carbon monoxide dehydrogenase small subunit (CoxS/CutS family)